MYRVVYLFYDIRNTIMSCVARNYFPEERISIFYDDCQEQVIAAVGVVDKPNPDAKLISFTVAFLFILVIGYSITKQILTIKENDKTIPKKRKITPSRTDISNS